MQLQICDCLEEIATHHIPNIHHLDFQSTVFFFFFFFFFKKKKKKKKKNILKSLNFQSEGKTSVTQIILNFNEKSLSVKSSTKSHDYYRMTNLYGAPSGNLQYSDASVTAQM